MLGAARSRSRSWLDRQGIGWRSSAARRAITAARISHQPSRLGGLKFEPLHFADRLRVVNPGGDVGLVTLWSPWEAVQRKLTDVDPAILDPARSRVAAIGSLYGD